MNDNDGPKNLSIGANIINWNIKAAPAPILFNIPICLSSKSNPYSSGDLDTQTGYVCITIIWAKETSIYNIIQIIAPFVKNENWSKILKETLLIIFLLIGCSPSTNTSSTSDRGSSSSSISTFGRDDSISSSFSFSSIISSVECSSFSISSYRFVLEWVNGFG